MKFAFPRRSEYHDQRWAPVRKTVAWLSYKHRVIAHLQEVSSLFWFALIPAGLISWHHVMMNSPTTPLPYRRELEIGFHLYLGYACLAFLGVSLLHLPCYLWVAYRRLVGPPGDRSGPLAMLLGGHQRWREKWLSQVVEPNERLAEEAKKLNATIAREARIAKEEGLRGEDLQLVTARKEKGLRDFYQKIPNRPGVRWHFMGRHRNEFTATLTCDDIVRHVELCLAGVTLSVGRVFENVTAILDGADRLVMLIDRPAGPHETKILATVKLERLGGGYRWRLDFYSTYSFGDGFARHAGGGVVYRRGESHNAISRMKGMPLVGSFFKGWLAPLNPLNVILAPAIIYRAWCVFGEASNRTVSVPYFEEHYLGRGDFTDLCLIYALREALPEFQHPTEDTVHATDQLVLALQSEISKAIRSAVEQTAEPTTANA